IFQVTAQVSADNDFMTANNSAEVQVGLESGIDLGVTVATSSTEVFVTDVVDYTMDVTNHGVFTAQGGTVTLDLGGIPIESVNAGPNNCTIDSSWYLSCQLADLNANATTRIVVRGRADRPRQAFASAYVQIPNDSDANNNWASFSVVVKPES